MVVQQRNEVTRSRVLFVLTIVLSAVIVAGIIRNFSQASAQLQRPTPMRRR